MKKIFFTPGPSQLFPSVGEYIKQALSEDIASISHRSQKFEEIYYNTTISLKKLLDIPTKAYQVFFLSSATEAMERIIENCVEKYSFHFVNGAFSEKFFEIANDLKKEPMKNEVEDGQGFNFKTIKIPKKTELICFTRNETSTGVSLDPK